MALFKNNRPGRPSDKVTFVVHGAFGNLITRIRARTSEKLKGIAIWKLVKETFNFSEEDVKDYERQERKEFSEDYVLMKQQRDKLFFH